MSLFRLANRTTPLRAGAARIGGIAPLGATSLTARARAARNAIQPAIPVASLPASHFASAAAKSSPASPPSSSSTSAPVQGIPVIDLSGTFGSEPGHLARRKEVAKQIDAACREIGFFTIVNHGIPKQVVDDAWSQTAKYFDLPASDKNKIQMDKDYPYGYSGFGGEDLSKGYGEKGRPDPKESFCIGPYNTAAGMPPVKWPDAPAEFKKAWIDYYSSMERLAAHLLSLFALALDLKPDWFEKKIDRHRSALRALNYPKLDKALKAGEVRAGAHTDYGSLTILLQDNVGGLQVRNRQGEWVDAVPRANSFVINLGDLMARWSNDRWVSTLHRVVQPPQAAAAPPARRQSMAFFHNINADQMVECIPTCTGPGNPPKHPPITAWDLLIEKHSKATTY